MVFMTMKKDHDTDRDRWSVAEAKARLSNLLARTQLRPQTIDNRGVEVAVMISIKQYRDLVERAERSSPEARLAEFLEASEQLRDEGGAELRIPKRAGRPVKPLDDQG